MAFIIDQKGISEKQSSGSPLAEFEQYLLRGEIVLFRKLQDRGTLQKLGVA